MTVALPLQLNVEIEPLNCLKNMFTVFVCCIFNYYAVFNFYHQISSVELHCKMHKNLGLLSFNASYRRYKPLPGALSAQSGLPQFLYIGR